MPKTSRSLLASAALLTSLQVAPALAQERVEGAAALRAAIQRKPVVRVIATVRAPQGFAAGDIPESTAAKSRLVDEMRAANVQRVEPLAGLPLVVLELDGAGLQRLIDSGEVVAVQEDVPEKAVLPQSGPLVRAPDAQANGATGAGRAVAILDTGVDSGHPFLGGRVVAEACFSTTSAIMGSSLVCPNGSNQQTGPGAAQPCGLSGCNHGTHVAGIAAGSGAAFSGMAPNASIVAVQIFSRFDDTAGGPTPCADAGIPSPCVLTSLTDQARGLAFVRDNAAARGIAAANMSIGGGRNTSPCTTDMRRALVQTLRGMGVATVIAAGNDGFTDAVSAPGCIPEAITVGSTTKADAVSSFSNSTSMVDLLAPGSNIQSSVPGGGFASFSGTSMATPHVTGAIAALRTARPNASLNQVEAALKARGHPITDSRNGLTLPRLDIEGTLAAFATVDPCPPLLKAIQMRFNKLDEEPGPDVNERKKIILEVGELIRRAQRLKCIE